MRPRRCLSRCLILKTLCASNPDRLVVIDEAYYGFGADTAAPLIEQFDNLLITQLLEEPRIGRFESRLCARVTRSY